MLLKLVVVAGTITAGIQWNHGVMRVTRDAFVAGAVPEPGIDFQNWYLQDASSLGGSAAGAPSTKEIAYDIRSARRIPQEDDVLIHVIRNSDPADILVYQIASRCLLRLP